MKITIGIPAYNEEKNIKNIIIELKKTYDSIIVCDDGSTDSTYEIIKKMNVNVIKHEKNLGYGAAINSIFKESVNIESDVLVTFDADGQHRIEDIGRLIEPILDNSSDIVIGSRFLDDKTTIPSYRKFGIKIITQVTNASIKKKLTDSQSGLRAYNKNVLEEIAPSELGMGISTEILIKASSKGLRIIEVPIKIIKVEKQIELIEGEKSISINKSNVSLDIEFEIKYKNEFINSQKNKVSVFEDDLSNIYNSRTFCLYEDIEKLKKMGLGKGGTLENALVVKGNSLINEDGLRNEKEFVNHKILDCMGDLYLSGFKMIGSLTCSQGGHYLTNKLLRKLFSDRKNYSLIEIKGKNLPHSLAIKNQLRSIA